jgi:hypothetical protein
VTPPPPSTHTPMHSCARTPHISRYWSVVDNTISSLQVDTPFCFGVVNTSGAPHHGSRGSSARNSGGSSGGGGDGSGGGALVDCTSPAAQFSIGLKGHNGGTIQHQQSGLCVTTTGPRPPLPPPPPPRPPDPPNTPCPPLAKSSLRQAAPAAPTPPNSRPCDIYAAAGSECVAAHSVVRALYSAYAGVLYTVRRERDGATATIGVMAPGGLADAAAQDRFCAGDDCRWVEHTCIGGSCHHTLIIALPISTGTSIIRLTHEHHDLPEVSTSIPLIITCQRMNTRTHSPPSTHAPTHLCPYRTHCCVDQHHHRQTSRLSTYYQHPFHLP